MKKFWIQVIILMMVLLGALYVSFNPSVLNIFSGIPITPDTQNNKRQLVIKNTTVSVEVADTGDKRRVGLSGRSSLGIDEGMLFVFSEVKKHRLWMKGMNFPLDFIFLRDGKVVDLLKNVPPPEPNQKDETLPIYEPVAPVDMLLEVPAGFIDLHKITVGDSISVVN